MTRWSELDVQPHGTPAAYRRHYRHGEKPCEACRQAESVRLAESAARGRYEAARQQRYHAARAAGLSSYEANRVKGSAARLDAAVRSGS